MQNIDASLVRPIVPITSKLQNRVLAAEQAHMSRPRRSGRSCHNQVAHLQLPWIPDRAGVGCSGHIGFAQANLDVVGILASITACQPESSRRPSTAVGRFGAQVALCGGEEFPRVGGVLNETSFSHTTSKSCWLDSSGAEA